MARADFRGIAMSNRRQSRHQEPRTRSGLKWGRDPSTAEITGGNVQTTYVFGLQWGRDPSTAEIPRLRSVDPRHATASMGPRSIDRGNPTPWVEITMRISGFNGAAMDRPRRSE